MPSSSQAVWNGPSYITPMSFKSLLVWPSRFGLVRSSFLGPSDLAFFLLVCHQVSEKSRPRVSKTLLTLHLARGPMQRPDKLPLVKLVVSRDEGARRDDPVSHLLEGVQHVEGRRGEFDAAVLLVPPLGWRRGLLGEHAELVQRKAVNGAAETKKFTCHYSSDGPIIEKKHLPLFYSP